MFDGHWVHFDSAQLSKLLSCCDAVLPSEGYVPQEWLVFEQALPMTHTDSSDPKPSSIICTLCAAVSPLEGSGPHDWVVFERALVVTHVDSIDI